MKIMIISTLIINKEPKQTILNIFLSYYVTFNLLVAPGPIAIYNPLTFLLVEVST